jgi:hypothetical protein
MYKSYIVYNIIHLIAPGGAFDGSEGPAPKSPASRPAVEEPPASSCPAVPDHEEDRPPTRDVVVWGVIPILILEFELFACPIHYILYLYI